VWDFTDLFDQLALFPHRLRRFDLGQVQIRTESLIRLKDLQEITQDGERPPVSDREMH